MRKTSRLLILAGTMSLVLGLAACQTGPAKQSPSSSTEQKGSSTVKSSESSSQSTKKNDRDSQIQKEKRDSSRIKLPPNPSKKDKK
ncbi:hypothetical protein [Schleiferilactobacillus perolens]|uniref:hypothetical protein n=1 Tax=Schleiferilactobacillus perolens TaxID=100468 RepID=UPI000B28B4A1|nr:hypothetical protein [Schleiferilactobacillus perolens]